MEQDEDLPMWSDSARVPGSADWWREQMRFHIAVIHGAHGKIRPNAAANTLIRLLERNAAKAEGARDVLLDIQIDRSLQIELMGYDAENDDRHTNGEIAVLAALYAMPERFRDIATGQYEETITERLLPKGWRLALGDRRRELVKAAALIVAEIERLDRMEGKSIEAGRS
ncbi:hypothetical protein [Parachitinimonas caeni]|uniref:Uncharacterized protein n=1 Tax=Parachitinimonas caeni TaxID=3031301 RepID=A0ABT7E2B4_9NEIS|nr:hypothetical protein [Parachitinimonas caeni]MDK2126466.1 hypothetical protein [Parachitinimonas caeni]